MHIIGFGKLCKLGKYIIIRLKLISSKTYLKLVFISIVLKTPINKNIQKTLSIQLKFKKYS